MKMRWIGLVAGICILCGLLAGCGDKPAQSIEPAQLEAQTAHAEAPVIYPEHAEDFFDDIDAIKEPPEIIYSTPASENGLGNTMYKIVGTVEKVVSEEESEIGSGYFVVKTEKGEMVILDPFSRMLDIAYEEGIILDEEKLRSYFKIPAVEDDVCVYAKYMGLSEVLQFATALYGGDIYGVSAIYGAEISEIKTTDTETTSSETTSSETTGAAAEPTTPTTTATMGQKNALAKAKDYLAYTAFSYNGLIEQLEYEGYTTEEATYGADNCGADWKAQAAKKAQDYIDLMSFSKSGLIEQLVYEGFTQEQAEYGATAVGY